MRIYKDNTETLKEFKRLCIKLENAIVSGEDATSTVDRLRQLLTAIFTSSQEQLQ